MYTHDVLYPAVVNEWMSYSISYKPCNTSCSPSGGSGGMDRGSALVNQGGATVGARVSVVWVEETPERSAGKLPSVPANENWRTIAGAVTPAGVADIVDSVGLPTIAGATPPADFAKVVAADAASLADTVPAGIPFPADPVGTLSLPDQNGTLTPTDPAVPAGIPFPADSVGTLSLPDQNGTLSPTNLAGILFPAHPAGILFPAVPAGIPFPADSVGKLSLPDQIGTLPRPTLPGYCSRPTLLEYCFRPFLLGYRSRADSVGTYSLFCRWTSLVCVN